MPDLNNDKNVYLLGAGFSREAGLPLQDDFLLVAKEVYFKDPTQYEHFQRVFEYQDRLTKMKKYLNYPLLNLEQLFNLIEMNIFYSKDDSLIDIKNDFIKLVCDVLINKTPCPFYNDKEGNLRADMEHYDPYLCFLKLLIKDDKYHVATYDDTIISFNYDLIVEGAASIYNWKRNDNVSRFNRNPKNYLMFNSTFGKSNIAADHIGNCFKINRPNSYFPPESVFSENDIAIKLLKLHGSINWKTTDDGRTFIVPPTWNKSDSQIRLLWYKAYEELVRARRIIVIGCSFPETDIYVKSLLGLAVNENRILQSIYFINPDTDIVKRTCLSMLDRYFEKHCAYKEWTFSRFIGSPEGKSFIKDNLNREV